MGTAWEDFRAEREALRTSLAAIGPDAPTACGSWTTTDLALHIVTGELARGIPNAPFRLLVSRGVRLDRLAGFNTRALRRQRERHGFDWAMQRLAAEPPRIQRAPGVASVSLLEMWAHHEDVVSAHDGAGCTTSVDHSTILAVLCRYQRRLLGSHGVSVESVSGQWFRPSVERVEIRGPEADLARWLSGRGPLDRLSVTPAMKQASDVLRGLTLHI